MAKTEKTGNDIEVERIMQMSVLDYVLANPSYLSDPYYRVFTTAIYARDLELDEPGK